MIFLTWLKQTPLWLLVPSLLLTAGVATAVAHHEPLVFDPSLYEVATADAAELETIDAEAIEAANAANAQPADVPREAPASTSSAYADGEWTGYAACGKGNSDNWKPYYVGVVVEVKGGKPQGLKRVFGSSTGNAGSATLKWDASENQKYLDWAISGHNGSRGVKPQLAGQSVVSDIDTVSGATYSSVAIFNAYVDALGKASKAAGNGGLGSAKAASPKSKKTKKSQKVKADTNVGTLADGTWTAYVQCGPDPDDDWKPYYIGVTLTVKDGAVVSIDEVFGSSTGEDDDKALKWDAAENQAYLDWALNGRVKSGVTYKGLKKQIEASFATGGSPSSIDTVSGATFSSRSIFAAYYAALAKSAAAAGSTIQEPAQEEGASSDSGSDAASAASGEEISISGNYTDGTYTGYAFCESDGTWSSYYVFVEIEVKDGLVTTISNSGGDKEGVVDADYIYSAAENGSYLKRAIKGAGVSAGVITQIQDYLDKKSNVGAIDTVSQATISSNALVEAFKNAIDKAAVDNSLVAGKTDSF